MEKQSREKKKRGRGEADEENVASQETF